MLWKLTGYSLYLLLPFTIFLFPLMPVGVALICMGISYCLDRGESANLGRRYTTEVRTDADWSHGSDARDAHVRVSNWP